MIQPTTVTRPLARQIVLAYALNPSQTPSRCDVAASQGFNVLLVWYVWMTRAMHVIRMLVELTAPVSVRSLSPSPNLRAVAGSQGFNVLLVWYVWMTRAMNVIRTQAELTVPVCVWSPSRSR